VGPEVNSTARRLRVAAVQDAPAFLDPKVTTERIIARIQEAAAQGVALLAFPETFLPGYPMWFSVTGGAAFDEPGQKAAYAQYVAAAVRLDGPELAHIGEAAREFNVSLVLGVVERAAGPASASVYATAVSIDAERGIVGAHRKLVPTWEERLVWTPGDGHGLRVHRLSGVAVSVLNCWENWMPQARFALWAQAPAVHVAIWPGSARLTRDITRFVALEGRCFVISASGVMHRSDIGDRFVLRDALPEDGGYLPSGGSAIAAPDGQWLVEPREHERGLVIAELELDAVLRARHNLDVAGHYHRPDVFMLRVDRSRREPAHFVDNPKPTEDRE
jgi:nitrilase